jgi:hypothetical protein
MPAQLQQLQVCAHLAPAGAGLRAALAARAYKREVVLIVATPDQASTATRALLDNLARLGMEHAMLLSGDAESCYEVVKGAHAAHIGCVWEAGYLPVGGIRAGSIAGLWKIRYRLTARAARIGYGVLSIDADVVIFDDPYRFFKAPPFSNFTVINQPEMLYSEDGYKSIDRPNGGLLYVQNAAPDGPTVAMLATAEEVRIAM